MSPLTPQDIASLLAPSKTPSPASSCGNSPAFPVDDLHSVFKPLIDQVFSPIISPILPARVTRRDSVTPTDLSSASSPLPSQPSSPLFSDEEPDEIDLLTQPFSSATPTSHPPLIAISPSSGRSLQQTPPLPAGSPPPSILSFMIERSKEENQKHKQEKTN